MNTQSSRLRVARLMTGLNRTSFCKRNSLSPYTIRSYELGKLSISEKYAEKITLALANEGVVCHPRWLLEGLGLAPTFSGNKLQQSVVGHQEELLSYMTPEAQSFLAMSSERFIVKVDKKHAYAPIDGGDLVGGSYVRNLQDLKGNLVVIWANPKDYYFGYLEHDAEQDMFQVYPAIPNYKKKDPLIETETITKCGVVFWIMKKSLAMTRRKG